MKTATLGPAAIANDEGTRSPLACDGKPLGWIQELPDRNNLKDRSRVNAGLYYCAQEVSPAHGLVYRLHKYDEATGKHDPDVDGHTHVLIHIGNLAGDITLGFVSDSEACLLPGTAPALFRAGEKVGKHLLAKDQHGVAASGAALKQLVDYMQGQPFLLKIIR